MTDQQPIPTTERLALALEEFGAPQEMITRARAGYYDDFKSDLATPLIQLACDAHNAGLGRAFHQRIVNGDFDGTREESDAWAASPEGQEIFRQVMGEPAFPMSKNPYSSRKKRRR